MTNEPPTGDGEELVEADLPGLEGSDSTTPEPPSTEVDPLERIDESVREWGDALDEAADQRAADQAVAREDALSEPLSGTDVGGAAERGVRPGDSFFDAVIPDDMVIPNPPSLDEQAADAESILDEFGSEPTTSDLEAAAPTPIVDQPQTEEWVEIDQAALNDEELVEADLPTTSSQRPPVPPPPQPEPEQSFDEIVDDRIRQIGENLDAAEQAAYEAELQAARDEYGPDVDVEELVRHDRAEAARQDPSPRQLVAPQSWLGTYLTIFLAGAGVVTAVIAAFLIFGGSDDAPATALPANDATVAPTVAPTAEPTTVSAAATVPRLAAEIRLEQLAFDAVAAMADADGDLWLTVGLQDEISVDPDTLAFVYAFAIGAAMQTEGGYSGFYYAITNGSSYGEAVFGSPDFPRTSREFNQNFQIAQPELWMTEDGRLAIHLAGDAAGNGLDASLFGPGSTLIAGITAVEEQGGTGIGGFEELTLGEIIVMADIPLESWVEIEPDQQPLRLNVPDTSNQN